MQAKEFLALYKEQMLEDLAALVEIESVEGPPQPGAPFGRGPRRALDKALEIAARLGLRTQNGDGYLGWAQAGGGQSARPYLASITHLDVVPAGGGWTGEAFSLRRREGVLMGRGVSDDKGPSVLMLYTAKYLQEEGLLRYPFRVLLGCSEETGMKDVPYYLARQPQPAFLFSPDGEFPVCNGEKGIYTAVLEAPQPKESRLVSFSGGSAANMTPDRARAVVRMDGLPPACEGIVPKRLPGGLTQLEAFGVGGHAAMPQGARNAIGMLTDYLEKETLLCPQEQPYFSLLRRLFASFDGGALGLAFERAPFTPLTCVGSVMRLEKGRYRQTLNIRYPAGMTGDELTARLEKAAAGAACVKDIENDPPFYISAENPAIETLLQAYSRHTGKPARPFTMGGGTYARHFENAVSFGMEQPKELLPAFAGPIHGADEALSEDWFFDAFLIYADAVAALQKLEF